MKFRVFAFTLSAIMSLAFLFQQSKTENDSNNTIQLTDSQAKWVQVKLKSLTLREKIAQMVVSSTFGEDYDTNSSEFKKMQKRCMELKVGGFILKAGSRAVSLRVPATNH